MRSHTSLMPNLDSGHEISMVTHVDRCDYAIHVDRCDVIAMAKHLSYTAALKLNVVDALRSYMYFALKHEALVFSSHSRRYHTALCCTG